MLKKRRYADEPTPLEGSPRIGASTRLCLLIIGEGFVSTHPLPESGDLIIGRSEDADIPVDVTSVSRRHALLHIGSTIRLEDLGSANGTFVNDSRLERGTGATLSSGSMFELGSTMFILQDGYTARRPRRIWTHGYFEARLEEECDRGQRGQGAFSLARIRVDAKPANGASLHELVLASMRPGDVVATYGPDDYEALILDATPDQAREIVSRVTERLRARGAEVRAAIASYPHEGRVPEALMARACSALDGDARDEDTSGQIVIEAGVMKTLHRLVERVAASDINVLVLGETGVGKEVFAERIHTLSPRVAGPLLRLNCAALSESLLESELFGHERGAFTGANTTKPGLLETANGGTVFLDEIGDMPLSLQAKLLRVLEARCVRRVGGLEAHPIDIRVVAATHRDLESEVADGRFRQDLFFRLNGMAIVVPPLRERGEELEALAMSFIKASCKRQRQPTKTIDERALRAMRRYEWPGNIRELRNLMERAVVLSMGSVISLEHLPADKMAGTFEMSRMPRALSEGQRRPATVEEESPADLKAGIKAREREIIKDALARANGNQTRAAKLLGISRRTLISRIEDYGLPRPRKNKRA